MSNTTPRIRRLLSQANRLAEQNRFNAAEKMYREIAAESPDNPEVLLPLARVVRDEGERQQIYLRVLELEPKNYEAKRGVQGEVMSVWHHADDPNALPEIEPALVKPTVAETDPESAEPVHIRTLDDEDEAFPAVITQAETNEVGLRCNKCGDPIDMSNSVHTPVGYRCRKCVRELEEVYFSARPWHYLFAGLVALSLTSVAAYLIGLFPFWLIAIFAGSAAGTAIGRLAFRAAGRNRGRYLPAFVGAMVIIGSLLAGFFTSGLSIAIILFAILATSAAYYQLR